MSKARLGRMYDVMVGHVERGEVPGIVTLVRHGHHVDSAEPRSSHRLKRGFTRKETRRCDS